MSDRRRRPAFVLLLLAALAPTGAAQSAARRTADSLAREFARAERTSEALRDSLEALQRAVRVQRDARIEAGGRVVRYSPLELDAADTAAIARGLAMTQERLTRQFGAAWAARLVDRQVWVATARRDRQRFGSVVSLQASDAPGAAYSNLNRPIDPVGVERFALRSSADRILVFAPHLQSFVHGQLALNESERFAEAARELTFAWAAAGRRCAGGVLAACEAVMTLRGADGKLPDWLDASDTRAAVTMSETPLGADSAVVTDRRLCLRGDNERCSRAFSRLVVKDPFSGSLRASLAMHAIERGGQQSLDRIVATRDSTPLASLAIAAGMTTDELLSSWQQRTADALEADRGSTLPVAASSLFWCALLVGATTRRRP